MIRQLLTRARPPLVYAPVMAAPWPTDTYGLGFCSEQEALDLPVVSAALDLLCSLIMQMPLEAVTADAVVSPTPAVLRNPVPAAGATLADFLCSVVVDCTLHGNYLAVLGDAGANGWPASLYPVPWTQYTVRPDGTYQVGGDVYVPAEVFHVKVGAHTGELLGRGLMETHPRLLAASIAAERFAAAYFQGGAAPPTVVVHPDPELTQERAELLKSRFRLATTRREAVVVPSGTVIQPLTADADKAQLEQSRRWNATNLSIALGVPPALLGLDSPSMTYRSLGEVYRQYISSTLMGMLAPLEQQLSLQLLPRNQQARFDVRPLLRPDIEARVDIAIRGFESGLMSRGEARSICDLPPDIGEPDAFGNTPAESDVTLSVVPDPQEVAR